MRISDWSSDVCSSDLPMRWAAWASRWVIPVSARSIWQRQPRPRPTGLHQPPAARQRQIGVAHVGAAKGDVGGEDIVGGDEFDQFAGGRDDADPAFADRRDADIAVRSEEHTSELQSLMRISYAVFCLKKKTNNKHLNKH